MADPAKVLFRNASHDGQLMRTLAAAMVGGADLGEAMATARRIGKPSGTAWYDAWARTRRPGAADRRAGPGVR